MTLENIASGFKVMSFSCLATDKSVPYAGVAQNEYPEVVDEDKIGKRTSSCSDDDVLL